MMATMTQTITLNLGIERSGDFFCIVGADSDGKVVFRSEEFELISGDSVMFSELGLTLTASDT
jgi:hypothetical protein